MLSGRTECQDQVGPMIEAVEELKKKMEQIDGQIDG